PQIKDLRPLQALSALMTLRLDATHLPPALLGPLADIPALTALWLVCPDVRKLSELPAHRQVTRLAVETEHPLALDALHDWPALTSLELSGTHASLATLADLRAHPR